MCDHAVAIHVGHNVILESEATRERLADDCCGGISAFEYCPYCGTPINHSRLWESKPKGVTKTNATQV